MLFLLPLYYRIIYPELPYRVCNMNYITSQRLKVVKESVEISFNQCSSYLMFLPYNQYLWQIVYLLYIRTHIIIQTHLSS